MEHLIETYGYAAVLAGTFLEGETVLLLGGFAAHQGHLQLPVVILAALAGSLAGDQLWFILARRFGRSYIERRPKLQKRLRRATRLLEQHPALFTLGFRFVYGVRNVAPVAVALSQVSTFRFVVLNAIAAALWSAAVALAGYVFGHAVEALLGDLRVWEERAAAAVALVLLASAAYWFVRWRNVEPPPNT